MPCLRHSFALRNVAPGLTPGAIFCRSLSGGSAVLSPAKAGSCFVIARIPRLTPGATRSVARYRALGKSMLNRRQR